MKTKIKIIFLISLILGIFFYVFVNLKIEGRESGESSSEKESDTAKLKNKDADLIYKNPVKSQENSLEKEVEILIESMTLEEKVAQLFVVLPEALIDNVECVTAAGEMTQKAIEKIPVGGFVYLSSNLKSESQVKEMLDNVQLYSIERIGVPAFLCIDEEGGNVARLSGTKRFDVPTIENMSEIGQEKDYERAKEVGNIIGKYLYDMGFNVDFAPVVDVLTNSKNEVVKQRSFGSDVKCVSQMGLLVKEGLEEKGVYATYKHFPGHGSTAEDTHAGYACSECNLKELKERELVPFADGIKAGISFIMVAHISLPNINEDDTPASLSNYIIENLLRKQMGYEGIVISDAMNMGAITQQYTSADATIKAIQAGVDLILMPEDFKSAYQGVINAVETNVISQERIDESLRRIMLVKVKMREAEEKRGRIK